jgi:DNA-binding NarL/FixJ family response regulator
VAAQAGGPAAAKGSTAVVVAGDEETRVLLRGLLRLHHVQVLGEAAGSTAGVGLLRTHHPTLLVADASLAEGSCASLVAGARETGPAIRVVVLTPDRRRGLPELGAARPDAVLTRPFRIHEFAEVIAPVDPASPGPATTTA